jgi:hypothetical protein
MDTPTETKPTLPEKIPLAFQLGDRLIDAASIRPATFASFAELAQVILENRPLRQYHWQF